MAQKNFNGVLVGASLMQLWKLSYSLSKFSHNRASCAIVHLVPYYRYNIIAAESLITKETTCMQCRPLKYYNNIILLLALPARQVIYSFFEPSIRKG